MFKQTLKIASLLFAGLMMTVFVACNKEETVVSSEDFTIASLLEDEGPFSKHGPRGRKGDCFDVVFPVMVEFPDGSSSEAANKEGLAEILKAWKAANPDATSRPKIAIPFDVQLKDGTLASIESEEDLKALMGTCKVRPHGRKPDVKPCAHFVFPVSFTYKDTVTTVNSREELAKYLHKWRQSNPAAGTHPTLVFPITIKTPAGNKVVNSQEELRAAEKMCNRKGKGNPCIETVFPVTLNFPDGTKTTVADREALKEALKTWKTANPTATERPTIAFPHKVLLKDGTEVTVNSKEDVKKLIEDCRN